MVISFYYFIMLTPFEREKIENHLIRYQLKHIGDCNYNGNTLIHLAASDADLALLSFAIDSHPELVNFVSQDGNSALHYVRSLECFHYLIKQGAKLNMVDNRGRHPIELLFAKKMIDDKNVQELYPYLTVEMINHYNLLHCVATFGLKDTLSHMLDMGADINCKKDDSNVLFSIFMAPLLGQSSLMNSHLDCICLLIDNGIDMELEGLKDNSLILPEMLDYTIECLVNRNIKREKEYLDSILEKNNLNSTPHRKL